MKKYFVLMAAMLCAATAAVLSSCSDSDDKKDEPVTLSLGSSELLFSELANASQSVTIKCSGEWTVSTEESWLDISPRTGEGDGVVNIFVNSSNNSSQQREGSVKVTAGDQEKLIKIVQKAAYVADCSVVTDKIVKLGDQFAFNFKCGANVSYFQWDALLATDLTRYTDDEIVENLKDNYRNPKEGEEQYFRWVSTVDGENNLLPNTEYVLLVIAYDKDGKRGDLTKTTVKTRGLENQAAAEISDLRWVAPSWEMYTTINQFTLQYYRFSYTAKTLEDLYFVNRDDVVAAWYLTLCLEEYPDSYIPAIQSGSWYQIPEYTPYFYLCTWAQDKDGEWSGVIDSDWSKSTWYESDDAPEAKKSRQQAKRTPKNGRFDMSKIDRSKIQITRHF